MNKTNCWFCSDPFEYDGEQYRDVNCPYCGIENSIYNPADKKEEKEPETTFEEYCEKLVEQQKEEKMPFEDTGTKNTYLSLPKQGEKYDYAQHGNIASIEKVANPDKKKGFNFTKKVVVALADGKKAMVEEDQGYFYLITFEDGKKLSISSWSPFFALKEAGVTEGVSFSLNHIDKGNWEVSII